MTDTGSVISPFNTVDGGAPSVVDRMTLVNGRTFAVTAPDGTLRRRSDGTVFEDLRMLSRFEFGIAGPTGPIRRELLGVSNPTPFSADVLSRPEQDGTERVPAEYFVHRQWVGRGVRHDIEIHNTGHQPIERSVLLHIDTDFAHLFDMKAGRPGGVESRLEWSGDGGRMTDPDDPARTVEVRVSTPCDVDVGDKSFEWSLACPPRSTITIEITFEPCWDHHPAGLAFPLGTAPSRTWPARSLDQWRQLAPTVLTDDARLSVAVESCVSDLASLRIFDREHKERVVIAAGAPWFMTLFGRDSLLTSWMTLPFLPELSIGTLDSLAALQGTADRPATEEQPGKILHELRRQGGDEAFEHRGRYYGSVDATPLFVMVAAEAHRWGHLDGAALTDRWPAIRAATEWVRRGLAADSSGFLRYQRSTEVGLANQGWKDSWDGISFADGNLPLGAIALAEVQGYAHAALLDAALLADQIDEPGLDPDDLRREADRLAERFDAEFWNESMSTYVVGLDGTDRAIDSITTNPGHAVWAGICDPDKAKRYLDRIFDDRMFSGWGLRTLSPSSARYDPLSYHNGSVWPHDTAVVAAGAASVGRSDLVRQLVDGALDVSARLAGRPPELFSGIDRAVIEIPVPYPSSCSPQAWASASTLLNLRSTLQLDPPASLSELPTITGEATGLTELDGIRVGQRRYAAHATESGWQLRASALSGEPAQ